MANKKVSQLVAKPSVLVTDLFPIADPTTGQLYKTTISDLGTAIGSGVSSVNTLVGAVVLDTDDIQELASPTNRWFTDTRARAALSASSPLAYNSGTGVFSIPAATSSQNGYLTSTDWTTFNSKQQALSGTGFVKISGTTISYDNSTYLTTSAAASTYLALAGGTLTGALNGTSANFTGDLTLSASNPRLYFTDTDNNPDYFISNTDGTFTIYDVTNSTSRLTLTNLYTTLNNTVKIQGDILLNQDSTIGPVAGYTTIASDSSGIFLRLGTATSHAYLVLSSLTSYRNFTLPDATGTFALTSDLSAYLPLAGGTMTGAITTTNIYLSGMTAGNGALYYSAGANRVTLANYNASGILDFEVNGGLSALTLNANLSATFAGALSGTSASFSSTIATIGSGYFVSSTSLAMQLNGSVANDFQLNGGGPFRIVNQAYNAVLLNVTNTGAATFSSSVTATQVGVNTTTPNAVLEVAGTSANTDFRVSRTVSSSTYFFIKAPGGTPSASTMGVNGTDVMTLNSSGNVGIGTTSPSSLLHVNTSGSAVGGIKLTSSTSTFASAFVASNGGGDSYFGRNSNTGGAFTGEGYATVVYGGGAYPMAFYTNDTERMRITSGGAILVNSTFSNGKLYVYNSATDFQTNTIKGHDGNSSTTTDGIIVAVAERNTTNNTFYAFSYYNNGGGAFRFRVADSGNVTNTNNSYGAISDIKLKENISDATSKLSDLLKIKVKNYNYIGSNEKQLGVIAQDVEEVFPGLVEIHKDRNDNGNDLGTVTKSVKYSVFVPMLIKAIQELKAELDTLKNK